jgi:hypothetical protein
VREAVFPVGATDDEVVGAYVAVCSARTRIVDVEQITSSTASVLAAAMVAAIVDPPVLVDAAHVSVPHCLALWTQLGGWDQVRKLSRPVTTGQGHLASALGTPLEDLPDTRAPTMRLVRLPQGLLQSR